MTSWLCPRCRDAMERDAVADTCKCATCGGDLLGNDAVTKERLTSVTMSRGGPGNRPEGLCPKCGRKMHDMSIGGVGVDTCIVDGYMWFDGGDLDKIRKVVKLASKTSEGDDW